MTQWWESLGLIQQVYAFIAVFSTALLLIQTVLVLFGIGDGETDADVDVDADADIDVDFDTEVDVSAASDTASAISGSPSGLLLLSIRGVAAFFSIGGWCGLALFKTELHDTLSIIISLIAGTAALFGIALLMRWIKKLQSDGTVRYENAIGKTATVYIPIPAQRKHSGKVTISFQGRYMECDAVTDAKESLRTGVTVIVVKLQDENTLLVMPQEE